MLQTVESAISLAKSALGALGRCRAWLAAIHQARETQSENADLRAENTELKSRVRELQSHVSPAKDLVYSASENVYWRAGHREEGPFCPWCLDCDGKAVRLSHGMTRGTYHCPFHRESFTTAEYSPRPIRRFRRLLGRGPREF